jgi:hypothetical protein
MRSILTLMFLVAVAMPSYAQSPPSLLQAVNGYVNRLPAPAFPSAHPALPPQERGWIARHPVLVGALVGAAAGAAVGPAFGGDCHQTDSPSGEQVRSCEGQISPGGKAFVGAITGSGLGALVGLTAGLFGR